MALHDYASFDPIFWLYHCNLDCHWLSWHTNMRSLDWTNFQSMLDDTKFWKAPLNAMAPFSVTTDESISFGVG